MIECDISATMKKIGETYAAPDHDFEAVRTLMQRIAELNEMKKELAKYLGERILSPHKIP